MKVLVTGGRDYHDWEKVFKTLDELNNQYKFTLLINGGAKGVDWLATLWAEARKIELKVCPANWKEYGRKAGILRNHEMLKESPDLVVAFPGGKGTANMVHISKKSGIEVIEIS